jgi:hypothetical protein
MVTNRWWWLAFASVVGCSTAETETALVQQQPPPEDPPTLPEGLEAGWTEMNPGGATQCVFGDEYAFWVRRGSVNRVVVDFIGGGACWDAFTCGVASAGDAICSQDLDGIRDRIESGVATGFYDDARDDNPFKDWYHVIVPYCSCDIHWGNNEVTYPSNQGDITIAHRGAVNSQAVLDWVYASFSRPEQILVTGCSAGSYGSIMWSAHIAEHYPKSRVIQFGDSGAGIITQTFFEDSFPSWQAEEAFPEWIAGLDPSVDNLLEKTLADLYVGIANHYPTNQFSQYNTAFDENQTFYFVAMGGSGAEEWSERMHASIAEIQTSAATFTSFIAPGEQHCILPYDNFFTVNVDGRLLVDWLGDMLAGTQPEQVACVGAACDATTP